ncbi:hypothetical protein, conserved [Eimeria praecox]|uniref:Uncharacterized protein n=1 Tax=Eimeria praecox TaxID=51316 RepID=U6GJK9_9EIME|nr:hypothetical protein, conserved [Eimeria praecox]
MPTPSREPDDAFSSAEKPSGSPSPEVLKSGDSMDAGEDIVLQTRPAPPAEEALQEGDGSDVEALGRVPSIGQTGKSIWKKNPNILTASILVATLMLIARMFSSKLVASLQGAKLLSPKDGALGEGAEGGASEEEPLTPAADLRRKIRNMTDHFRRAAVRAETWANSSESVLLSIKGGEGQASAQSTAETLAQKMSSIAYSLVENVGPICAGLEDIAKDIETAETQEQAAEAAARVRALVQAVENIGSRASVEYFRVAELTATLTSQARMLLEVYPEILVLANNLSDPLPKPYTDQPASQTHATRPAGDASFADLKTLLEAVSVTEALQEAKMQKILSISLQGPHVAHLIQLVKKCSDHLEDMRGAMRTLTEAQESAEAGRLPEDRPDVKGAVEKLLAVKAQQEKLGEELRLELDLRVEQALEHLEVGRVLLQRGDGARWKKSTHPLLLLARSVRRHAAGVYKSLSRWREFVQDTYP